MAKMMLRFLLISAFAVLGFNAHGCQDMLSSQFCGLLKSRRCSTGAVKFVCQKTCGACQDGSVQTAYAASDSKCADIFPGSYCTMIRRCLMPRDKLVCRKTCNLCHVPIATRPPTPNPHPTFPVNTGKPSPSPKCGMPMGMTSRVVKGTLARTGAWPWQVRLMKHNRPICGGTIISPHFIVTASHCVARDQTASLYKIEVGAITHNLPERTRKVYSVRNVIMHPSYDRTRTNNDIALIRLNDPIQFNDRVQPACLPKQNEHVPEGQQCYITGFGKTKHPGSSSKVLMQAALPVVSQTSCSRLNRATITSSMLCAGSGRYASSGGCHGDSGGPFVCQNPSGAFVLQGAVSWGPGTCESHKSYTVFARVAVFRRWIDAHVNQVN